MVGARAVAARLSADRRPWIARLAIAALACIACHDDTVAPPVVLGLEKTATASGDMQTDTVRATIAPFRVLVRADGSPAADVEVAWTISVDTVVQSRITTTTNSAGIASLGLTFGDVPHAYKIEARIPDIAKALVTFTASSTPGHAALIRVASGADQVDTVTAKLAVDYVVQVTDRFGNVIVGRAIDWAVISGGGSITPASSVTTAPTGLASATYTLGQKSGASRVTATVHGVGALVTFQAMATAGRLSALTVVAGNGQSGETEKPLTTDYVVRATDSHGNPIGGVSIDWTRLAAGGALTAVRSITGADGTASTRYTLGPLPGEQMVVASATGLPAVTTAMFSSTAFTLGALRITTTTTGVDLPPNGYFVSVNAVQAIVPGQAIGLGINGVTTVTGLPAANYLVTLVGVQPNCDPGGPTSRNVNVPQGAIASLDFEITCTEAAQLAVAMQVTGNTDIYRMKSNGTGLTRLTTDPAYDGSPAWSPDGSRIAFVSYRDGQGEIYVMNADGSGQTRLTAAPKDDVNPVWSPDGTRMAFTSFREDNNGELYVINANGSGEQRLTVNPLSDGKPVWSPDSRRIVYESRRTEGFGIFSMNADGTDQVRITSSTMIAMDPAVSPDGRRIAFSVVTNTVNDLYAINADGSGIARVVTNGSAPKWSPDGLALLFTSNSLCTYYYYYYEYPCDFKLNVTNANGSGMRRLTGGPNDSSGRWSPDGRVIAYTTLECTTRCDTSVWLIKPDGTLATRLAFHAFEFAWKR
jgi:TolB protein